MSDHYLKDPRANTIDGWIAALEIFAKYVDRAKYHYMSAEHDILYIAEYSPIATGCDVVALDLKTGKQLWKSELEGIGPVRHSKYLNLVNIETDGQKVIVLGNEASGRYIELLDLQSGKMLTNKQLDADPQSIR